MEGDMTAILSAFRVEVKGSGPQHVGNHKELEKQGNRFSIRTSRGAQICSYLILYQGKIFGVSEFQNC